MWRGHQYETEGGKFATPLKSVGARLRRNWHANRAGVSPSLFISFDGTRFWYMDRRTKLLNVIPQDY